MAIDFPTSPTTGQIYSYGSRSWRWNGTAWDSVGGAGAAAVGYYFIATAGQTTFSGADANSLNLLYTVGTEQVFLNGVYLVRGSDYTASTGTSIVLTNAALANDVLNVVNYGTFNVSNTYTIAQTDALFQSSTVAEIMEIY